MKKLAAIALALGLAGCGGASDETKTALTSACQVIEKASAEVCGCKTGVLASNMESKALEVYAFYRAEWAKNAAAHDAIEKAEEAAAAKFSMDKKDVVKITNEASLKYRNDLKACEKS